MHIHIPTECAIETQDGCTWLIEWSDDVGAFFVDVEFFGDTEDPRREQEECTCPGPGQGHYAQLETLEVSMGQVIPDPQRQSLLIDQALLPTSFHTREEWTIEMAESIYYLTPEGEVEDSCAPPWADDPWSPAYVIRDDCERDHFWERAR